MIVLSGTLAIAILIAAFTDGSSAQKAMPAASGSALVGAIQVERAWTRQPPPGAKVAAAYATITNTGTRPDRLIGGGIAHAERVEVHTMSMEGGVMRMARLDDGLTIEPGETVVLAPGGPHLMLIGIGNAPKAGSTVPLTLRFERAGEVTVAIPVAPVGARSAPEHDH